MGLRQGEKEWKDTLDQWIGSHHEKIMASWPATTFRCWT